MERMNIVKKGTEKELLKHMIYKGSEGRKTVCELNAE